LLAVALSLSGCGSHALIPISQGTCTATSLAVTAGPDVSEKTGQVTETIVISNTAVTPCVLNGYPSVTLVDSKGRSLPFAYRFQGDEMITSNRPRAVRVAEHGSAAFALNQVACQTFTTRAAREVRFTLPGADGRLSVRLPREPFFVYCGIPDPGHEVDVSPIESSLAAAFAG
jgi:hypothetical protein